MADKPISKPWIITSLSLTEPSAFAPFKRASMLLAAYRDGNPFPAGYSWTSAEESCSLAGSTLNIYFKLLSPTTFTFTSILREIV